MWRVMRLPMAVLLGVHMVGCATLGGKKLDPTAIALAYYAQTRTYEPVRLSGVKRIVLEAAEGQEIEVVLTSQLEPLSIYPRDPVAMSALFSGLKDLAAIGAAGFVGYEAVQALGAQGDSVGKPIPTVTLEE